MSGNCQPSPSVLHTSHSVAKSTKWQILRYMCNMHTRTDLDPAYNTPAFTDVSIAIATNVAS